MGFDFLLLFAFALAGPYADSQKYERDEDEEHSPADYDVQGGYAELEVAVCVLFVEAAGTVLRAVTPQRRRYTRVQLGASVDEKRNISGLKMKNVPLCRRSEYVTLVRCG